ncbi:EutN/CcmL family microcompartment protein [bacterium]|nr:EutN/CcmL family microcompartment protein [bacterium]
MIISRVVGDVVSTQKNANFEGHKLLIVQPVEPDGDTPRGPSMIALDKVDAGASDLVLVNKEGSSARLLLDNEEIPVQAVVVAVIDGIDLAAQN